MICLYLILRLFIISILTNKVTFMSLMNIDPKLCKRWQFADRSEFEFGNLSTLAEDIRKNGQINPVIARSIKDPKYRYEIIAGSRRWKACLLNDLPLSAIVDNYNDEKAAMIQIKENSKEPLSDYSKGMNYSRIIESCNITQTALAINLNYTRNRLINFLAFAKLPEKIWQAVQVPDKVSSRTAAALLALSNKGEEYNNAIIEIAEEIRSGAGSTTIERLVNQIVNGKFEGNIKDEEEMIVSPEGQAIASWKKGALTFSKDLDIDRKKLNKMLIEFFKSE